MTVIDFAKRINACDIIDDIQNHLHKFIEEYQESYEQKEIVDFIDSISTEKRTAFVHKVGYCKSICIEQLKNHQADDAVWKRIRFVREILDKFDIIYEEITVARQKKLTNKETNDIQNEEALTELNNKYEGITKLIKNADEKIDKSTKVIDEKIFSLLINTVSILGIFVAIAFVGFEVTSIFSMIDIKIIDATNSVFIRSIFYFLLCSWVAYNLLLLLVYFVFKLSRPLQSENSIKPLDDKTKEKDVNNESDGTKANKKNKKHAIISFYNSVNLTPFLWIDGILFVLVAVFFFIGL